VPLSVDGRFAQRRYVSYRFVGIASDTVRTYSKVPLWKDGLRRRSAPLLRRPQLINLNHDLMGPADSVVYGHYGRPHSGTAGVLAPVCELPGLRLLSVEHACDPRPRKGHSTLSSFVRLCCFLPRRFSEVRLADRVLVPMEGQAGKAKSLAAQVPAFSVLSRAKSRSRSTGSTIVRNENT